MSIRSKQVKECYLKALHKMRDAKLRGNDYRCKPYVINMRGQVVYGWINGEEIKNPDFKWPTALQRGGDVYEEDGQIIEVAK